MIRPVRAEDAAAIAEIYNYYVENTAVTFEEVPVSAAEMAGRIETLTASWPWLVREDESGVMGYAYAGRFRERASYRHTVELSLYLRQGSEGKGAGTELLDALLGILRTLPVHAVLSVITEPNPRSAALHERAGFHKAGLLPETGRKHGAWHDVSFWELLLPATPENG